MNNTATKRAARLFHLTLAATGSLAAAARAADITAAEARRLRELPPPEGLPSPAGQAAGRSLADSLDRAVAALEEEAVRRALFGVTEPVFHQGRECGSRPKHSDALLIFLLKTLRPERYGPPARRLTEDGDGGAGQDECEPLVVDFGEE